MLTAPRSSDGHWFFGPVFASKAIYFQVMWASGRVSVVCARGSPPESPRACVGVMSFLRGSGVSPAFCGCEHGIMKFYLWTFVIPGVRPVLGTFGPTPATPG